LRANLPVVALCALLLFVIFAAMIRQHDPYFRKAPMKSYLLKRKPAKEHHYSCV
jgi:hypothetical protein